ncbi:MAG: FHA domain-containing protein [Solirubrobacterales bacterium]|nr:FHA domain-containing protein [Solirubrobacterales bacterium]
MRDPRILDTPTDLKRRLEAERRGVPFVCFRDGEGTQQIIALDPDSDHLSVGRDEGCEVCIGWDERVSRLHARLERSGGSWTVYDGGLSTNGTFLNGERVHGHRVLNDRDQLRFGDTEMSFRDTTQKRSRTVVAGREVDSAAVSPAQRKVLVALCRPYKHHSPFARPASNRDIAGELVLSVESVKSHLRALFAKFDLDDLPQNEKRVRLVEHAFQHGLVRDSEL